MFQGSSDHVQVLRLHDVELCSVISSLCWLVFVLNILLG